MFVVLSFILAVTGYFGDMATEEVLPNERMTPVFSSSNHDAEMEALAIRGVLEASGVPAMIVGPSVLPNLEWQVQVPQHQLTDAREIIRSARQGGRQAADDAERETR
jgi:hypothetical protein